MLVSPKWQMMWLESQYCSKSIVNLALPSQRAQKVLEDLRTSCCSPNKAVQLEALKCWEIWISHQNPDDWKQNTVCFTGVRPLITKKLQPLHKDVDICKMKLSLMWALLTKVQNIMQLEGPQYILEVFLQSCFTWLSSYSADNCENEISSLIFQLLLGIFEKTETLSGCDNEIFPPLSADFFHVKKVFQRFVDKFLNIFTLWRIIQDRKIFLRLWKYFLEHCELSFEHIPTPVWHSIFKLTSQVCSEKNETIKMRLAFLHSCATSLKSALSSSKFNDFSNLLATPCEALLKKLVELCREECDEFCDSEMFLHSKEICEVLLSKSVAFEDLDFCISILDVLEEFHLRSLLWGVWCGLVYCYKVMLHGLDKNHFTRIQLKFYRKLRGIAINFELDRNKLYKDCIIEVEKHIDILDISCFCSLRSVYKPENTKVKISSRVKDGLETLDIIRVDPENQFSQNFNSTDIFHPVLNSSSKETKDMSLACYCGKFSVVALHSQSRLLPRKAVNVEVDIIKETLKNINMKSIKLLFNSLFSFRFISLKAVRHYLLYSYFDSSDLSLHFEVGFNKDNQINKSVYSLEAKASSPDQWLDQKSAVLDFGRSKETENDEKIVSVRCTRSRKRAEEEKEKLMEKQRKKKRKSFEVLVQEIVRKNKERKTEKNSRRRKSPVILRSKRNEKKMKKELKEENQAAKKKKEKKPEKAFKRKLRNLKKKESNSQKNTEKKPIKTVGKLENYFKIISKTSGDGVKKEKKKPQKRKITKRSPGEISCCKSEVGRNEKKNETSWRQTSLKVMMNQRNKAVKVEQGSRTRHKATGITDEKQKKNKNKKSSSNSLAKLSPFKEVYHDHEYARLKLEELNSFENILVSKKKAVEVVQLKRARKSEQGVVSKMKKSKPVNLKYPKSETKFSESKNKKFQKIEEYHLQKDEVLKTATVISAISLPQAFNLKYSGRVEGETENIEIRDKRKFREEKEEAEVACLEVEKDEEKVAFLEVEKDEEKVAFLEVEKEEKVACLEVEKDEEKVAFLEVEKEEKVACLEVEKEKEEAEVAYLEKEILDSFQDKNKAKEFKMESSEKVKEWDCQSASFQESLDEFTDKKTMLGRRDRKRVKVLESLKPSKKIKFEDDYQEEKFPLEITEKENLEERSELISPSKKEKTEILTPKSDGSSNTLNRRISSRALRMIALVPESIKGDQMQWEASPRVEILKCKKAPNVDKNSRASKMLALLSENVEAEESDDVKMEEVNSNKELSTSPNVMAQVSSLKSPKSIRKRKFIRFDDAKNETVLYLTDTPPSQILEEKEKCRKTRSSELIINLP